MFEPLDCLQESLLFGKLDLRLRRIPAHGEAMFNTAEQVDLVLLADLLEDFLGLVPFWRGKDGIGF